MFGTWIGTSNRSSGAAGGLCPDPDGRFVKPLVSPADQNAMASHAQLPGKAGPVPDRLTIWPIDDGRYGLDATFQGASGYERAEHHRSELQTRGVQHSFRQEFDGGWTLRFGPLRAVDVARPLSAFVY